MNRVIQGHAYRILATRYFDRRDFKRALEYYQIDLCIAKDTGDKNREGYVYSLLGSTYLSLGEKAIGFHPQGPQALGIAKEVKNKDLEGKAVGDFKQAAEFYQQALSIAKKVGDRVTEGTTCGNLGIIYGFLGDAKRAIEFYQLALSISKEVGDQALEGKTSINLANAYSSLGHFKTAIEVYLQALKIGKEQGDIALQGTTYGNLGTAYHYLNDFKTAIDFYQHALCIATETGDKASEGETYSRMGFACNSVGDFKRAIEFHRQALSIAKDAEFKYLEGKTYSHIGIAYHFLGDFKSAIEFHQQAVNIANEVGNKASEATACGHLGAAYRSLGDFKTAIDFHQQALTISREVGDKASEGEAYGNLGTAYHSLGNFKQAIEFLQEALTIAKNIESKPYEGTTYVLFGTAYYSLGDFETAIEYHHRGLTIAKELRNKPLAGGTYANLGIAYHSLGDYRKVIEFSQQALDIAKETGVKGLEGVAYSNLGSAYYSHGDFKKAIESFQHALGIAKEVGDKASEGVVSSGLGIAYRFFGDIYQAERYLKSSVGLLDDIRGLLQTKDEWKIELRNHYKDAYNALWNIQLEQNKIDEALLSAERGRAQALIDLMESQYGVQSVQSGPDEQTGTVSHISSLISSSTIFIAVAPDSINYWVLQEGHECQFVKKVINNTLQSLNDATYKQIGVFKSVVCEDRSLDEPADEDSGGPVKEGFTSLEGGGDALKMLSDVVITPISHLIQGDEVTIVPDGSSFLVPYAALMDQHSRHLSEKLKFRLIPSLTSLKLMAECPEGYHSTSGALLVGDPLVEGVYIKGKPVTQLPYAKKEVEMIGAILKIDPLTGKDATKAEVLRRLNSVALVHIAAHGRAETGEIVLSPDPTSSKRPKEEDFLLTMADVLKANLRARLVVLSCCHSGQGKIKAEGVVGIARAFLGAGARSILASLWAIDDEATLEFMRNFYEHLMEGQSASTCIQQAMKAMRESDNFSAVKYWAPFVLIGDDVTLNFEQSR